MNALRKGTYIISALNGVQTNSFLFNYLIITNRLLSTCFPSTHKE